MTRLKTGLSYKFNRNLGKVDRILRFIFIILAITSWYLGFITEGLGIIVLILAFMTLGTVVTAKCSVVYLFEKNTMSKNEKNELDEKGIPYE